MKRFVFLAVIALLVISALPAMAGNGAPGGAHYNLNIHGVDVGKTADMTNSDGHSIFVWLNDKSSIWLCQSGSVNCAPDGGYQVLDANGTDKDGALFALPNPDPTNSGTTTYSVFARELGKPGGAGSSMTTCAYDPLLLENVCSLVALPLERKSGQSKFDNVSKELLYIYADINGDSVLERVPLFSDQLQSYFWQFDNKGLRLVQLRFYECGTTVPGADDLNGLISSTCAVK